jgi:FHA domain-containing protein
MTFPAQMHIASVEIVAALGIFALIVSRPRVRPAADAGGFVPVRIELDVYDATGSRRVVGLAPLAIGRSSHSDLALGDPEVSRQHARFESAGGTVYVRDTGSSNGTFLNGRRVTEAIELRAGDLIDVGSTRIIYVGSRPERF